MQSAIRRALIGWLVLVGLTAGAAYANPANCDDDMTEDQRKIGIVSGKAMEYGGA